MGGIMTAAGELGCHDRRCVAMALEEVPVPQVLLELGMHPEGERDDVDAPLDGAIKLGGHRLVLSGCRDWLSDRWNLLGTGHEHARGTHLWEERVLPGRQPRGKTVLAVLAMWRRLVGRDAQIPPALLLGAIYEATRRTLDVLVPGVPKLLLDGRALRQVLRLMRERHAPDLFEPTWVDRPVALSCDAGLLRLEVDRLAYGIGARGHWTVPCSVSLAGLLALPRGSLGQAWWQMVWAPGRVVVQGYDVGLVGVD